MSGWQQSPATALLILADGTRLEGRGIGAVGHAAGEVCFNTAMTGYQEILTDPSYAGQIITFTFPHIGNVGTNDEDIETVNMAALSGVRGCVLRADITNPSNYRAAEKLDAWLKKRNIIGITGIDTRALTARIRESGMPNGVIAHSPDGYFHEASIMAELKAFPGLEGLDLAKEVTTAQTYKWDQQTWKWGQGYRTLENPDFHIVAVDYGAKRNILRCLADQGARVTVVPATATAKDIMAHNPDGIFLSNGPGDPAATGKYAVPTIKALMDTGKPMFGICLGHQLLGLAVGGKTSK
ncbi:MAG: carbamoyl-phosphate synthase small subunit, partial [Alphaproteobacteria bacterium]